MVGEVEDPSAVVEADSAAGFFGGHLGVLEMVLLC